MLGRRLTGALGLALAIGILAPAGAVGATVVGQAPPAAGTPAPACIAGVGAQKTIAGGNSYVVPTAGVFTGWRTSTSGSTASFMTLTPTAGDPATLTAKTRSAVIALSGNSATVVPTRQPAAAGDVIGFQIDGPTAGCFFVTGDAADIGQAFPAGMALNVPSLFFDQPQARMNLAGDLEPDADADGFGDETQDAAFTKVPKKKTTSTKATFGLTGAATFVCTLDGKAKACTASTKLRKLKVRRHTFTAHAVTVSGESSPDVTFKWKVTEKKK